MFAVPRTPLPDIDLVAFFQFSAIEEIAPPLPGFHKNPALASIERCLLLSLAADELQQRQRTQKEYAHDFQCRPKQVQAAVRLLRDRRLLEPAPPRFPASQARLQLTTRGKGFAEHLRQWEADFITKIHSDPAWGPRRFARFQAAIADLGDYLRELRPPPRDRRGDRVYSTTPADRTPAAFEILRLLSETRPYGALTTTDIEIILTTGKPTAGRTLKEFIAQGLVQIVPCPLPMRSSLYTITNAGLREQQARDGLSKRRTRAAPKFRDDAAWHFETAFESIIRLAMNRVPDAGFPVQSIADWKLLLCVAEHEATGGCTTTFLIEQFSLPAIHSFAMLRRLERCGWLNASPDEHPKRLRPGTEGRKALHAIENAEHQLLQALEQRPGWSKERIARFASGLIRFANLTANPASGA